MASKKHSSAIVDALDVAYLMDAFQQMNSCILSFSFEVTTRRGTPDLMVIANAFTVSAAPVERVPLVSFRSTLSQLNSVSLEGATILCLYRLDALLAAHELDAPQLK